MLHDCTTEQHEVLIRKLVLGQVRDHRHESDVSVDVPPTGIDAVQARLPGVPRSEFPVPASGRQVHRHARKGTTAALLLPQIRQVVEVEVCWMTPISGLPQEVPEWRQTIAAAAFPEILRRPTHQPAAEILLSATPGKTGARAVESSIRIAPRLTSHLRSSPLEFGSTHRQARPMPPPWWDSRSSRALRTENLVHGSDRHVEPAGLTPAREVRRTSSPSVLVSEKWRRGESNPCLRRERAVS